ncbi:hypothetical protein [Serratia fonticola]
MVIKSRTTTVKTTMAAPVTTVMATLGKRMSALRKATSLTQA